VSAVNGFQVVTTDDRVDVAPFSVHRWRWFADRSARYHNRHRVIPSYECRVIREDRRWKVVAFQNLAVTE
jgi:hypothetical protein